MNETYVTLAGLVATKPEAKMVNETRLISFRLVATVRRFDKVSGSYVDKESTWATVTCWRALAVNVERSVTWKDRVIVRGRMRTHEWLQDGVRRTELRITADSLGPDLAFGSAIYTRTSRAEPDLVREAEHILATSVEDAPLPGDDELESAYVLPARDERPEPGDEPDGGPDADVQDRFEEAPYDEAPFDEVGAR